MVALYIFLARSVDSPWHDSARVDIPYVGWGSTIHSIWFSRTYRLCTIPTIMSTRNPSAMGLTPAFQTISNVLELFIVKERAAFRSELQRLQSENESLLRGQNPFFLPREKPISQP